MSFRNNLQHLRAVRGMTQEQLAMLLGVSRQSVTKWEAERAYPEMDKLLKMCQVFDCTLDELVQGDLTARPAPAGSVAAAPHVPQDLCGYDEHMRAFAARIPAGVAAILLGVAAGVWLGGVFMPTRLADVACLGGVLIGVLAGLALIVPAALDHGAFVKAHPFVEDFYTVEQKAQARTAFAYGLVVGIALIFAGLVAVAAFPEDDSRGAALFLTLAAAGVWSIVHFAMLLGRTNLASYNDEAAEVLSDDEIDALPDERRRAALRSSKRTGKAVGAACGIIMMLATVAGLVLLLVPEVQSPYFWLSWAVGGLLCGVASVAIRTFGPRG